HGWFWERDHVYRDGQLLAEVGELNVLHRHVDHLGSLRQVTDELGIWQEDHAYLPFGEEVPVSSRAPLQFTGHERDSHGAGSADDLDYMHARYYSPGIGRFLSVDPENDSSRKHPQSRNRYTYARNNPLKYVDRDGKAIDTALDVGFVLFDVGDIAVTALKGEEVTSTQKTALAADLLGAAVPFATGAGLATRLAPRLAVRSGVLGKVGRFFFRRSARGGFIGQGVSKAGLVQSGRSRGFQRVNSNLSGGAKGAQDLFQGLTGRTPSQAMLASEGFDRVVLKDEGLEVVFRGTSSSGAAKVEVINLSEETIEKITFSALPE
ncbi:MAG: RHS repeat-associated core domain-containing protein, partial [Thermoanaerobaculia bacterium]